MGDVVTARVGDIVATLKRMGRQHALMVDHDTGAQQYIRGLLPTSRTSLPLGGSIDTTQVAGNLANLPRTG